MKFKRQFNSKYKGTKGETNNGEMVTIPDQHLSIKQLLDNHTRGIDTDVRDYKGEYFEETEIPIFDDLTDREKYKKELEEKSQALKAKTKAERSEASKKRKEAAEAAKINTAAPSGASGTSNNNVEQILDESKKATK